MNPLARLFIPIAFSLGLPSLSLARVVPLGINQDQIKTVGEKFSGLLSSHTSNSPFAVGEDFELALTAVYQDLKVNKISDIAPVSSEHLLEPLLSIRKGLYQNLDLSFSFLFPVESALVSGYSFSVSHASKLGVFYLKPDFFISNYNLDDVLNMNSSGASVVAFKKTGLFYFGLGAKLEVVKAKYENQFLGSSSLAPGLSNKSKFSSISALAKLVFISTFGRVTASYVFTNNSKSELSISLGFRL